MIDIVVFNKTTPQLPTIIESATATLERNTAGKLTFAVEKTPQLDFTEGDAVSLNIDNVPFFKGYVFEKSRNKSGAINVTAFDSMRYLKAKGSYFFRNKQVSNIVGQIATDFLIKTGTIADGDILIPELDVGDTELLEIILSCMDNCTRATGKLYTLRDNVGTLEIVTPTAPLPVILDASNLEDYDYTSSINTNTYNKIIVTVDNEETGVRELYVTQDAENISNWGILQTVETAKTKDDAMIQADAALEWYNQKTRKLSLTGAQGDPRLLPGECILVNLNIGDMIVSNIMMIYSVEHKWDGGRYSCDINVMGGEFTSG